MIILWVFVKRCENGVHVFKQGKVDDSLLWVQKNYKYPLKNFDVLEI